VWREYPAPRHIDGLMTQWLECLNGCFSSNLDPQTAAEAYADLHLSFVTIHPFFDGNGRMARLLANLPVLNAGLPPIVVPQEDRYRYKRCLSNYQSTVENLPDLHNLSQLPDNPQKQHFTGVCQSYWAQTTVLLDQANAMQKKRLSA